MKETSFSLLHLERQDEMGEEREREDVIQRNSRAHDDWRVDQYREMTERGGDSTPAWV